MMRLADGDKSITVDGTDNKAEMGALARALAVFKDNALGKRPAGGANRPPRKNGRKAKSAGPCWTLPPAIRN